MGKLMTAQKGKIIIYLTVIYLLSSLIIGLTSTMRGTDLISLSIVIISLGIFTSWLLKYRNATLTVILIIALLTRITLAITQAFIMPLPDSSADANVFEKLGWDIASAWNNGMQPPVTPGAYLYSKLIGFIYYLTGRIPFMVGYFNVILGVLTVYFVYKLILKIVKNERAAALGALIAAFYPTLNLYSAITIRENLIAFFSIISVYCFIKWIKEGSIWDIIMSIAFLLAAASFHGAVILIGGAYIFYFCFYSPKQKKWGYINRQALFIIIGLVVFCFLFRSRLLNKLPADITLLFSPEYIKSRLEPLAAGRGAYLAGYYPNSLFSIILQTPVRVVYFLFMPFPWKITGLADFIGFMDAFLYAILIIYSVKGFWKLDRYSKFIYLTLLIIFIIEVITFAWGTSNYGTAIRHRQKMVCLLISTASLGIAGNGKLKAENG